MTETMDDNDIEPQLEVENVESLENGYGSYRLDFKSSEIKNKVRLGDPLLSYDLLADREKSYYNFFKTTKWSPDGTSIISSTQDRKILVFYPPVYDLLNKRTDENCSSRLSANEAVEFAPLEGTSIPQDENSVSLFPNLSIPRAMPTTAMAWYPYMNCYQDSSSSCFLVGSTDCPLHLLDGLTGETRGAYPLIDHRERFIGANSITFHPGGRLVYCGYENMIHIIDITRPGWEGWKQPTCESRKSPLGHKGIISEIAFFPDSSVGGESIYAAGSFSGDVAVYDERSGNTNNYPSTSLPRHPKLKGRGITHLQFSTDSPYKLYCGGRRSSTILEYDLRSSAHPIQSFHRPLFTDQRLTFDIKSGYLASGDQNGYISLFDLNSSPTCEEPCKQDTPATYKFKAHSDTVSSTQFHPYLPILLSASGSRSLRCSPTTSDEETGESEPSPNLGKEATLKLWCLPSEDLPYS